MPSSIFRNVRYEVAGKWTYKGDLILTKNSIFYFPHTDLTDRVILTVSNAAAVPLAFGLAPQFAITKLLMDGVNAVVQTSKSKTAIKESELDWLIQTSGV